MKGSKFFIIATALSVSTSTFAAIAIPTGWYLEGNIGRSISHNITYITGTSVDNRGLGWNVNGGFKFMPNFAMEVGYTNYASADIKYQRNKVAQDSRYVFSIAGKGILPLYSTGFELFGKIGAARISSDVSVTNWTIINANNLLVREKGTQTSVSYYYGLGGDYSVTNSIAINGQWARAKGNSSTGILDLFSVGVTYIFG